MFAGVLNDVELSKRRQRGLPQADSPIVRRDSMVRPYLQRFILQQRLQIFQQQLVLEDTAGENDSIQAMTATDYVQGIPQPLSNPPMKETCTLSAVVAASPVLRHGLQ